MGEEELLPPLRPDGAGYVERHAERHTESATPKRRTKEEMEEENRDLFAGIVDLRAARVARRHTFDFAFTTDGVGARVQMRRRLKGASGRRGRGHANYTEEKVKMKTWAAQSGLETARLVP